MQRISTTSATRTRRLQMGVLWAAVASLPLVMMSCGGGGGSGGLETPPDAGAPVPPPPPEPPPPPGVAETRATELPVRLSDPWSMAFLPDGRMLVTQRGGSFVVVRADGSAVDATIASPFTVFSSGQGGLLDVKLAPDFDSTSEIYWTFSEPGSGSTAGTAVARGTFTGSAVTGAQVIYRQVPKVSGGNHFGSRLAFRSDGTLYVTLGDRNQDLPENPTTQHAQNVAKTLGKVIRINRDGTPAAGNPTFSGAGALPELWSIGHRNPQGAAIQPGTDDLWLTEHGPRGGDELNRSQAGLNFGWPLRSYGCPYSFSQSAPSCRPGGGTHAPTFVEPKTHWQPISTAPSGLMFYTGDKFTEWQGHAFVGGLAGTTLWRIPVNGIDVVTGSQVEVAAVKALNRRIRFIAQGPDGFIYLLSTEGRLIKVER